MKNIRQLFKGEEYLMDFAPVDELIEYCRELEGNVFEKKIEETYNKEHILKSMLSDILTSCREHEENKLLQDRYPELYEKVDADSLVKNLMDYIISMNAKNDLRL
jgi:hypothetical protein